MDGNVQTGGRKPPGLESLAWVLWIAIAAAAVGVLISFDKGLLAATGIVLLIFVAAFASGSFLGFLFGVPRVLSNEGEGAAAVAADQPVSPLAEAGKEPQKKPTRMLRSNTNLERISDWLTTMLVGATLVQLYKINDLLVEFRQFLAEFAKVFPGGAPAGPSAGVLPVVGPIVLIFGAVCGFLYMYLNTRLILSRLFHQLEEFLEGRETLNKRENEQVRSALASEPDGGFVRNILSSRKTYSVEETIDLMRAALYRENGYEETIKLSAALSDTKAVRIADYWFLLAAAFAQKYRAMREAEQVAEAQQAAGEAMEAARRAIALDPAYRTRIKELTFADRYENDFASLYAAEAEFRRLVDQP